MLVTLIVYPIFLSAFLYVNRGNLDKQDFRNRYESMYQDL